jgi:hypothetical protein
MNRTHLAELITIVVGVATLMSGAWSCFCSSPKPVMRLEGCGDHSLLRDVLVGKIELSDQQIDQLAAEKIKSIRDLRPLVHQLFKDVRQLKTLKTIPNYDLFAAEEIEQRIVRDRALILKHNLEAHQTMSRILGS